MQRRLGQEVQVDALTAVDGQGLALSGQVGEVARPSGGCTPMTSDRPDMDDLPAVMDVRHHVAPFLGVSENLVYAAIRQGELPAVRIGRRIVISKRAFVRWLEGSDIALEREGDSIV